jgi:multidrug efflux system membrane fusion protein
MLNVELPIAHDCLLKRVSSQCAVVTYMLDVPNQLGPEAGSRMRFQRFLKRRPRLPVLLAGTAAALLLAACGDTQQQAVELPPRAIKYMKLDEVADTASRTLAGVVKAGTQSGVAFETGGRVVELKKSVGDQVQAGEELSRLDPEPFELRVNEARFSLNQAQARLKDAEQKHFQQEELWKKRITTRTAYDTAVSNLNSAKGQVGISESQLELRQRDLNKTTLVAPFPGRIAEKKIDVFEEVSAGQPIYVVQTDNENEVEVVIPENLIDRIGIGADVNVTFPPLGGTQVKARVTEISPVAGEANAFPVTVQLTAAPPEVRPGMSAEVTFSFDTEATGKAFAIPIGALKPDLETNAATVFVYDEAEGVVRSRPVKVVGIDGNSPQIIGGVKAGEIIATAGVGHMYDGMKVRLLETDKPL